MTTEGLREAKRRATSQALSQAAYDLALERGVDGFGIDDIVARAGYSRRTFANHFSCKEEAIAAVALQSVRDGFDGQASLTDDVPMLDWLASIAHEQISAGLLVRLRILHDLSRDHPSLEPHLAQVEREVRKVAQRAIAARAPGLPAFTSHVVVGAVYGALMSVIEGRIPLQFPGEKSAHPDSLTVREFIDSVFNQLRRGF
ncbi:MAG TPA: TetR/AcrR family transcriptional regulator [Candidatus Nanopelagicales bacterium]|nr:TetR/AcrR family transcriptional regulator [Candidatus Nanopelagicales bacterium]